MALGSRWRGKHCRPYTSDTKVRVQLPTHVRFCYPDAFVVCQRNPPSDTFQDEPVVVFEVLSAQTRRLDEGEKKDAYLTVPSLTTYVLVEQESPAVIVYRRTENEFRSSLLQGLHAVLTLPELGIEVPLAEVYDGVDFAPEKAEA